MPRGVPHKPTDITRQTVKNLAADGVPIKKIASYMGLVGNTLHQHYQIELDTASIGKIRDISGALYDAAMSGNVTAMIFFLKCQAFWKETKVELPEAEEDVKIDKIQISVIK